MLSSTHMIYVSALVIFLTLILTITYYPKENKYDKTKKNLKSLEYHLENKREELLTINQQLMKDRDKLTKESLQYTLEWLYRNQLIDYNQYNELMLKSMAYIQ